MVGTVARQRKTHVVESYRREWRGKDDLPFARETFGAVAAVPMVYADMVVGVLLVVVGAQGHVFERGDVYLLELLAAEAAVAVTQNRLFAEQGALTHQVELARRQLETVLISTENPVIAVDRDRYLIFANPAAEALIQAHGPHDVVATFFPNATLAQVRMLLHAGSLRYELVLGRRTYACHLTKIGDKRPEGFVAVMSDISDLKELDRMKSEMVRMTSHDLKNPLQAAMANVDLLHEDLATGDVASARHAAEQIDRQLHRMYRIIRGILDLEKTRSGLSSLELCEPSRIIERVLDEVSDLAREQSIVLSAHVASDLPALVVDAEQFERALVNLVENAIKFTPPRGSVDVRAFQDGDAMCFEVRDTGVGIAPAAQSRVFDRFFRAKQRGVEHVSGSGLGLSLVKSIVDNHHGTIALESVEGAGTCFTVRLPLTQPPSAVHSRRLPGTR
jgi:two-component system phosphate regulon sensor histidine kinase PhoR